MDFYKAFELGLCEDCDCDPALCELHNSCYYEELYDNKTKEDK